MHWIYYVKAPQHWVSSSPPGYFIVQEESEDGDNKYMVYKGAFDDWGNVAEEESQLEKIGEFMTLREAKNKAPYQTSQ